MPDDTVFLGKDCPSNISFLKKFLVIIELLSGLKTNLSKCSLVGINMDREIADRYAQVLGSQAKNLPISYLGVNVGSSHRNTRDWKYLLDKVKGRIAKWKGTNISFGGRLLLDRLAPSLNREDRWIWKADPGNGYSVKKAYEELQRRKLGSIRSKVESETLKAIWSKEIPSKVQIHAWRSMLNRIPTKENLLRRNCWPDGKPITCNICNAGDDNVQHIFMECKAVGEIWVGIINWLRLCCPMARNLKDWFLQFINSQDNARIRKVLGAVWTCTIWIMWKERNSLIFQSSKFCTSKILDEIKVRVWNWLKG